MTVGAIVIPLAALALCAVGLALAWRLVRRAEDADSPDAPTQPSRPQPADELPGDDSASDSAAPAGAVRVVGQLMALAGIGLGALAIALALWRAFALHPLWLAVAAIAIVGGMAGCAWRVLQRR